MTEHENMVNESLINPQTNLGTYDQHLRVLLYLEELYLSSMILPSLNQAETMNHY